MAAAANGSKLSAKVDSIFSEVTHYGIEDQSGTRYALEQMEARCIQF